MSRDESEKKNPEELKRVIKKETLDIELAKLIANSKRYKISKMFGNSDDEITIVFKKKKGY